MQHIGLVAGEASGDILAADLLGALLESEPGLRSSGIAGPEMVAAGCEAIFEAEKLSVMGLAEVLKHLPELLRIRRDIRRHFLANRPDVFVGVDAPDFNLGLEKSLRNEGIPTVHYVSPSIWAWRSGRAARIGQSADRVLTLFPFEPEIYAQHGVDAVFVGHPLADRIPDYVDPLPLRREFGLEEDKPVLAMLPGSRMSEVSRLADEFIQTAAWLTQRMTGLQVIVPLASKRLREYFQARVAALAPELDFTLVDGRSRDAMGAADAVLLASGTAALEAMLLKRPMVVSYRVAWLTYAIVRTFRLLKVRHVSLPNVLAGRELVPELMQAECQAAAMGPKLLALLGDPDARAAQIESFHALHAKLRCDASARAAEAVRDIAKQFANR